MAREKLSLTAKECLLVAILIERELTSLRLSQESLTDRSNLPNRHKKILESVCGKNYFKTKTAIKGINSQISHMTVLEGKFSHERYKNG